MAESCAGNASPRHSDVASEWAAVRPIDRALAPLRRDPRVARVRTAYDQPGPVPAAVSLVSRDGRRMLATVELRGTAAGFASLEFSGLPPDLYPSLRGLVRAETLEVVSAGNVALNHDFTEVARTAM